MTRIKICGVTEPDDAARVAAAGVDFLGLNFWPRSKRYLSPERAFAVVEAARAAGPAELVGVFVDGEVADVIAIAQALGLDAIQLHGDESVADARAIAEATLRPVWKAIAIGAAADVDRLAAWPAVDPHAPAWSLAAVLLDAPSAGKGGAGQVFDWRLARDAVERHAAHRVVLAGGLGPGNVAAAIAQVGPWAVDVASGVEASPGVKDPAKVAAFVAAVRGPA